MFAICTLIIVSLLKAWKVTVAGVDATMPPFNVISESTHQKLLSQEKIFSQNSASKVANWIIVDILKYLD